MGRAPWKPGVRAARAEPDATPAALRGLACKRLATGRVGPVHEHPASHLSREADRKAASRCVTPAWPSRQTTSTRCDLNATSTSAAHTEHRTSSYVRQLSNKRQKCTICGEFL